jgi:hypothetical protein
MTSGIRISAIVIFFTSMLGFYVGANYLGGGIWLAAAWIPFGLLLGIAFRRLEKRMNDQRQRPPQSYEDGAG